MSKTALILIDIQNDYFADGRWPVAEMDAVAANAALLLARFREAGLPVVHVRHEMQSASAPFFVAGTPGAEIHPPSRRMDGEPVIVKHKANSFRDTALKETLDAAGVTDVVICGAMSQMCIDAGARAAADFGYAVTVASDACGAKDQVFDGRTVAAADVHAAIMAPLAMSYGKVLSTETVVAGIG